MRLGAALVSGILFGLGLAISQMSFPAKVVGFLDVAGAWDPSLLFVLGGAVGVTVIGFRFVGRMRKPAFDERFEPAPKTRVDAGLLGGSALFGIGWGLSGYCPGPGIVALGRLSPSAFVFVATFLIGSLAYRARGKLRSNVLVTKPVRRIDTTTTRT